MNCLISYNINNITFNTIKMKTGILDFLIITWFLSGIFSFATFLGLPIILYKEHRDLSSSINAIVTEHRSINKNEYFIFVDYINEENKKNNCALFSDYFNRHLKKIKFNEIEKHDVGTK